MFRMGRGAPRRPFSLRHLSEAYERHDYFWVFCLKCGHGTKRAIKPLISRYPGLSLGEYERRCKCGLCTARDALLVFPDGTRPGQIVTWRN